MCNENISVIRDVAIERIVVQAQLVPQSFQVREAKPDSRGLKGDQHDN